MSLLGYLSTTKTRKNSPLFLTPFKYSLLRHYAYHMHRSAEVPKDTLMQMIGCIRAKYVPLKKNNYLEILLIPQKPTLQSEF